MIFLGENSAGCVEIHYHIHYLRRQRIVIRCDWFEAKNFL